MRIGVLTYHHVPNFGAQLQATSTVGYIRRMGHEAIVLNWYPSDLEEMYSKRIPHEQIESHNSYTDSNLPVTVLCRTENDLVSVIEQNAIDAIIVGSDALFKYTPKRKRRVFSKRKLRFVLRKALSVEQLEGNPFFGGFISTLKRQIPVVAFSVSSQNCPFFLMDSEEKAQMRESMNSFSHITVRDEWTKRMVEEVAGIDEIQITPDPVFSFNQNCKQTIPSKEEILKKFNLQDKYILFSFSSWYVKESYINSLAIEAENRGYQAVALPMPEGLYSAGINTQIHLPLSPLDWYAIIKYSAGYIGERMHPIVVCLHNVIPFYSFDEYGTVKKSLCGLKKEYVQSSSKTYRILERAELLDNLFSYQKKQDLPIPSVVLDRILGFARDRCQSFTISYQQLYERSMNDIMNLFLSYRYE